MTPEEREEIMREWDSWRGYIAKGGRGSWPRDAFEALLDEWEERTEIAEAEARTLRNVGVDLLNRAEAAENNIEQQVVNAIKNRVALLEMQRDETLARAEAAEKEIAEFKVDADPVAWQNRYRSRSRPSEEWSEWSEWRDGKQPELRTKAEDGGCYDTEERPLYTRPDPGRTGGQAMTPTNEEIDEEVAFLRSNLRAPKAADMLLALKARAEALEWKWSYACKCTDAAEKRADDLEARAEAAETKYDAIKGQWQTLVDRAEDAEKERDEWKARSDEAQGWSLQHLARAKAAEKRWADYHTLASHSLAVMTARTETAEKALQEIATECSTFPIKNGLAFRCESIARAALEAKP